MQNFGLSSKIALETEGRDLCTLHVLLRHVDKEKQAAGGLLAAPLWHVLSLYSAFQLSDAILQPLPLESNCGLRYPEGVKGGCSRCSRRDGAPPCAADRGSAPTVRKAIPNLLSLRRMLTAACSPRQLSALPIHTSLWFVNQVKVEQMSRLVLSVLRCSDGACPEGTPVLGASTMALIEWIEWAMEQEMVLASGRLSISAQSLPAFHRLMLYSLERSFLGKYSNSHISCCPSLGHDLQL